MRLRLLERMVRLRSPQGLRSFILKMNYANLFLSAPELVEGYKAKHSPYAASSLAKRAAWGGEMAF